MASAPPARGSFGGLRLYLVCTPAGMPILRAPADPKIGEREVPAAEMEVEVDADVAAGQDGILLVSDNGFAGRGSGQLLAGYPVTLLRPSGAASRPAAASRCSRRCAS